jgi:hypothetical protein
MRESPAWTQWHSPLGLIRKAAMVLCGSCSAEMAQLDDQVGFLHHLLEQGGRVVILGGVALEQLLGREHDLVGRLAPTAAPAHAVGHDPQHAAGHARVRQQGDLVLLVLPVALVDAGGCGESITFGGHACCSRPANGRSLDRGQVPAPFSSTCSIIAIERRIIE